MPQMLIRSLDSKTVSGLRSRAKRKGRSLQAEGRDILIQASQEQDKLSMEDARALADRLRRVLGPEQPDCAELIREDRER